MDYDPATGGFTWKRKTNRRIVLGAPAGSKMSEGYIQLAIDGKKVLAHRLAWAMVHGVWPANLIDHKNGRRADNRIDNLRPADKSLNAFNAHAAPRSSTGYRGVFLDRRRGTFGARLNRKHLGSFATPQAASAVYEATKASHIERVTQ